jgi:hypothetical protein
MLDQYPMIVETTDNHLYAVKNHADYPQAWVGVEVKLAKGGVYVPKARTRLQLVRKEGSRVIQIRL